jgi:hypothetical protein
LYGVTSTQIKAYDVRGANGSLWSIGAPGGATFHGSPAVIGKDGTLYVLLENNLLAAYR